MSAASPSGKPDENNNDRKRRRPIWGIVGAGIFIILLLYVLVLPALCPPASLKAEIGELDAMGRLPLHVQVSCFNPNYNIDADFTTVQVSSSDGATTSISWPWGHARGCEDNWKGYVRASLSFPRKHRYTWYLGPLTSQSLIINGTRAEITGKVQLRSFDAPLWLIYVADQLDSYRYLSGSLNTSAINLRQTVKLH